MDESSERGKDYNPAIVGGRPSGRSLGQARIPQGIEVLVKKASIDPAFRKMFLEKRAEAAHEIDLELSPAEVSLLYTIPQAQIEQIIANTTVPDEHRRVFLGKVGAAMLGLLSLQISSCVNFGHRPIDRSSIVCEWIRPDIPNPRVPPDKNYQEIKDLTLELTRIDFNSVSGVVNYDSPFDQGEIMVYFRQDEQTRGPRIECDPLKTLVSKGIGKTTFLFDPSRNLL